jgi:hypothetical protein
MKKATNSPKEVVVTGDVTMDWNLARFRRARADVGLHMWWSDDRTRACWQRGGAAMLADLIGAAAKQPGYFVRQMDAPLEPVHPSDDRFHHAYALWDQFKGAKGQAWRVKEFLGLDRSPAQEPAPWQQVRDDPVAPVLAVLDDADLGFRDWPALWPHAVTDGRCSAWILVKMARPVAQGKLWEHLHRNCVQRLIIVTTINDLRLTQVQISRELSWERTAQDLFWELANSPHVSGLSDCAHVVISFDTAGALLLSRQPDGELECTLFFDPKVTEGGWNLQYPGWMIGYTSCLAAGIAQQIMRNPKAPNLPQGLQNGVAAMRLLQQDGYLGPSAAGAACQLAFPVETIAARIVAEQEKPPLLAAKVQNPIASLPGKGVHGAQPAAPLWTILHDRYPQNLDEVARRVVEDGVEAALQGVPMGQFGKLLTLDRREIEGYRSIRAVLAEYCSRPQKTPISVAVFGPPGAGKSFGVKQVAGSIYPNDPEAVKVVTFNLSQFHAPDELSGAFHQVRDVGLSGKMPLVFWDEFDSRLGAEELGWLRYLLAPMQDGTFQEGQITHPIGQAIFVFAGGTCSNMDDFARAAGKHKSAKAPDFVSRLKGYVNIIGPDPQDVKYPAGDPHFLIRRAILLRSLFQQNAGHLFAEPGGKGKLNIDPGVLHAFLHVSSYKHGARSIESVIAMSMLAGKSRFERSCLPSQAQLNLHVNGLEFLALVQQPDLSGELLERLAVVVHDSYVESQKAKPGETLEQLASAVHDAYVERHKGKTEVPEAATKSYDQLSAHLKQQNRENVLDISHKLASVGCVMIPAKGSVPIFAFSDADLEKLSEMEHDRWLRAKVAAGWRYGPERDDEKRTNPAVLPWRKLSAEEWAQLDPALAAAMGSEPLPEEEKEKDRALVRAIPKILAKAGYAVVQLQAEG